MSLKCIKNELKSSILGHVKRCKESLRLSETGLMRCAGMTAMIKVAATPAFTLREIS